MNEKTAQFSLRGLFQPRDLTEGTPWKTILARTVADGGVSHYIRGEHQRTVPALARKILELDSQRK